MKCISHNTRIRRKRIGNDLRFNWTILDGGNPYDLEGKNLLLMVKSSLGSMPYGDLLIDGNVISFTLYGKDQKTNGLYTAILVENPGEVGMRTVDITDIVMLVPHTRDEGGEDRCSHLSVETIDLTSQMIAGIPGKSAYESWLATGHTGSEEDFVNWLKADITRENIESALDLEEGKNLSTNDYTDQDKDKLEEIENGAQANVIERIKRNGVALSPIEKEVDITVPTSLSNLSDDESHRTVTDTEKETWSGKQNDISGIIPSEASSANMLADKNYVNDAVTTASADFKGTFESVAELPATGMDKNDYAYVVSLDAAGNTVYDRYKYNGSAWMFEYSISSPTFSASEWATIRSGMTEELRRKLENIPADAEANVQSDWNQDNSSADDFIKNKPTIPTVPTISTNIEADGTSDTKTSSPKSVKTFVEGKGYYTKPQSGIPASDIAPGVIPTVPTDTVKYTSQSLTDAQKTQARTNIGAADAAEVSQLRSEVTKLEDAFDERPSANLFDKSQQQNLGYLNSSGGVSPDSSGNYIYSYLVPILPNKYYYLSGRNLTGSKIVRCLDENFQPLKVLVASTGQERTNWNLPNEEGTDSVVNGQFKTPATAAYFQFNIKFNDAGTADNIMLSLVGDSYVPNMPTPTYVPFPSVFILKEERLPDGVQETLDKLRSEVDNTALSLVLGSLAIADGAEQSSTTRARTDYLYTAGELVFDPDVKVSCRYYNSSKVFQFFDSVWTTESPYSFNTNYPIVRIVVAYSNDAVISDVSTLASKVKIKGVVERVEELEERADNSDKAIKLSEPLKAKTIGDFVKYPISGYYARIDKDYKSNANYETYILPADGAKYVSAHIKGDATATAGVTCWSGPNPNTASRVKKIDNINGEQDVFFEVPSGTEQITFSSLSGTLDFTIYYEELPQVPANTLYIDELLNSDQSGGKIISNPTYNDRRVITKSICAFPYAGLKVKAHMPFNVRASFKITPSEGTQTVGESFGGWIYDGAELTFPYYGVEYRIVFAPQSPDTNTTTLPATYIRNCINAGLIWFSYETTEVGVVARNYDKDARVSAVKRTLTGLEDGMDSLFTFGHISDIHGDSVRFANFMDYLKAKGVDAALNSGDAVMFNAFDYTSFCKNIAAQYSIPYFFCIGNHESQPTGQTTLYEDNIQELVSPYGYLKAVDTPADNCYYYRDFSEKKIRLIVINYYNNGIYDGSLGQAQINWFIGVLASTPSGYGVLIMNHAAEDKVVVPSQYDAFFQKVRWTTGERSIRNMGGSKPIMNIVDAFISRTALSTSFSDNGTTVTVSADFSGITDDTIEFIAYVTGHSHEDYIGYYDNSINKQLVLGITCGNALYGYGTNKALANQEDLPRGGEGVCQDAFNIYSVDRVHKRVKIARIGADLNFNFEPREYMAIPYAE